jgi:ABC-2 type transport system ATP-binding protein
VSTAISSAGLTKRFGKQLAVDGVGLEVPAGSVFGFLGPNGSGKTTTIRMLLGLVFPTAGTHELLGRQFRSAAAEVLPLVGALVEGPAFHPYLSGWANLARLDAADRSATRGTARARIGTALDRVGLAAAAGKRYRNYSLGMRQRLGIARCLLSDPEVLFLDEPMNGLDPAGMLELRGLLREFVEEGRTVFLSSHLLDEVQRTCDFAAIVDRGRVVTQGSIESLTRGVRTVVVGTDDPGRAVALLANVDGVERAAVADRSVNVSLASHAGTERELVTQIVREMLGAGLAIDRVTPVEPSLEERFLNITRRLEDER